MTSLSRRALLLGASAAAAAGPARGQGGDWPARPIRMIVPYAPGGTSDTLGRLLGQGIAPGLGQPVVVENRAGAASMIGTEAVVRAAPDGHTLLLADTPLTIVPAVMAAGGRPVSFDPLRDLAPVATLGLAPGVLFVPAGLPVRNVAELVALARARPEGVAIANSGTGTTTHLMAELLTAITGTRMTHVPYRGAAPAVQDLAGGQVQATFVAYGSAAALVGSGQIRAVGVAGEERLAALPEVPTLREAGIDLVAGFWWGLMGPAGLPERVVARLAAATEGAMAAPELAPRLEALAVQRRVLGPDAFRDHLRRESARWTEVVQRAGIKPD
jgi:tripartite-type tricarboxylate transporter receptor subunit TctC